MRPAVAVSVCLIVVAGLASACSSGSGGGPSTPTSSTVAYGNPKTYSLSVSNQAPNGNKVLIASATLAKPGWVVIHSYVNGAPGVPIGASSLLPAGVHTDIEVTVNHDMKVGDKVMPVIHVQTGKSSVYSVGKGDPPATIKGNLVVVETITFV